MVELSIFEGNVEKGLHLRRQSSDHHYMSDSFVRATCPTCGDVVLAIADLGLQTDEGQSCFLFACPRCHEQVSREVPAGIIQILRTAGVHEVPPEPELIGADELAEFLADFERVDCLDQLRRLDHGA
jgi:hypothetical protein